MGKQVDKHNLYFEHSSYRAPSTPKNTYLDLKNGRIQINKTLNVRGMSVDEMLDTVQDTLKHTTKQTNILLIHGKGLRSQHQEPTLKKEIFALCYRHPQVLAYCPAQLQDGGSGATYLLITHD